MGQGLEALQGRGEGPAEPLKVAPTHRAAPTKLSSMAEGLEPLATLLEIDPVVDCIEFELLPPSRIPIQDRQALGRDLPPKGERSGVVEHDEVQFPLHSLRETVMEGEALRKRGGLSLEHHGQVRVASRPVAPVREGAEKVGEEDSFFALESLPQELPQPARFIHGPSIAQGGPGLQAWLIGEKAVPAASRSSSIPGITGETAPRLAPWLYRSYTLIMKTAISLPDALYEDAERLANSLGIPRSRLFAKALEEFIARHEKQGITRKLNRIYADSTEPNPTADAALERLREFTKNDAW